MVEYNQWVSIVRSEATKQGADLRQFEENSQVISVAADIWNDRKQELISASQSRARSIAQSEVNVA